MEDEEVKIGKSEKRKKKQKNEKSTKKPRISTKRKPGFDESIHKETEYFIKNGLRYVKPYYFTFTSYCKGRWLRRKLIDVLSQEFQAQTIDYYRKAIKKGNIKVNGETSAEDLILKDNDIITHKVHRHEPPVTAEPIQIIHETSDLVVVNKPSSIPIHPCGRYRHNTLVFLLGREFGFTNLHTIHRIDRLTSGIVIFAKSLEKARQLEQQLRNREMQKEYVCKVQGEFPSEIIDCGEPICVVSHKVGVCRVDPNGKSCRTVFTRTHYDGTNSIVKCEPHTGRMHQIRVHLQWLGYPIIDDPIYNHHAWGPGGGRGGVDDGKAWKVIESIATSLRKNDPNPDSMLKNVPQEQVVSQKDDIKEKDDEQQRCVEETLVRVVKDVMEQCTEVGDQQANTHDDQLHMDTNDQLPNTNDQNTNDQMPNTELKRGTGADGSGCVFQPHGENSPVISEVSLKKVQDASEVCSNVETKDEKRPDCTECLIQRQDPTSADLNMCLHAAVYKGPGWEFECPLPAWALPQSNTILSTDCT